MKRLRYFWPAILWTLVILILTLMPASDVPDTFLSRIPYFDKMVHCGIFAGFVFLWCLGLRRMGNRNQVVYMARIVLIAILLGLGIELAQKIFTNLHRDFEWWDWAADTLGAFFGGALFREIFAPREKEERTT